MNNQAPLTLTEKYMLSEQVEAIRALESSVVETIQRNDISALRTHRLSGSISITNGFKTATITPSLTGGYTVLASDGLPAGIENTEQDLAIYLKRTF